MKKHLTFISAYFVAITPSFTFAAANNFAQLVGLVIGGVKTLIPLVIALSLLYFSWGLFQLVKTNSEGAREDAIKMMTFGVLALFVMVSVWGLVNILTTTVFSGGLAVPQLK